MVAGFLHEFLHTAVEAFPQLGMLRSVDEVMNLVGILLTLGNLQQLHAKGALDSLLKSGARTAASP